MEAYSGVEMLSGETKKLEFQERLTKDDFCEFEASFEAGGYAFELQDGMRKKGNITYFTRTISGRPIEERQVWEAQGIRFLTAIPIPAKQKQQWRFCFPSIHYTKPQCLKEGKKVSYMEDRLTGNLLFAYNCNEKKGYTLSKLLPAKTTTAAVRKMGENRYLHKTEIASLGYEITEQKQLFATISFPYCEEEKSAALNSSETPVYAFYPLDGEPISISCSYALEERDCDCFTNGVYESFRKLENTILDQTAELVFDEEDSAAYRLSSLAKSYREFEDTGAGFFFHFDPKKGYGSMPSGFSTSYQTIPHDTYTHILEYGFTGRQINAAYMAEVNLGGEWNRRGERVVNFFIANCVMDNGFFYSLYDLQTKAAFFSCGDLSAPKLHYVSRKTDKGNYLRTMAEPANDILEYYCYRRKQGVEMQNWKKAAVSFGEFLINVQNEDGSFYRAYQMDGRMADVGGEETFSEAVTAIPIMFLCNLNSALKQDGVKDDRFEHAARRAADYTLRNAAANEHYQGGTLDNPNVVDKEAAQYVMAGLYRFYEETKEEKYAQGAFLAAKIFVTWNYIWNAPMQPQTFLYEKAFKTKGMGAINSIWGGGVVDIYSMFHIRELHLIGKKEKEPFLCAMAKAIASAQRQILSGRQDDMGFADVGMQPEGFGICPQGEDDGQIKKGDIWGTLGWIYSAGIYGLQRYLEEL